jgi:hypothetical protein
MASGFKNSAGTDLDSLFLTNNSNAGAIGFKVSGGQDLGNRYSNASPKLGQTTGYKNSAGTDLGNLRSNKAPSVSTTITCNIWYNDFGSDSSDIHTYLRWGIASSGMSHITSSRITGSIDGIKCCFYGSYDSGGSSIRLDDNKCAFYSTTKVAKAVVGRRTYTYASSPASGVYKYTTTHSVTFVSSSDFGNKTSTTKNFSITIYR